MLHRLKDGNVLMRLGMVFLILASLWNLFGHRFVRAADTFASGVIDGAAGVLYGLTIGCLLFAMRLKKRRSQTDGRCV